MGFTRAELEKMATSVPFWWHSIDLGSGVITNGFKSAKFLRNELKSLRLPDLRGKTVLDIGALDGFYSFEAERLGAKRVLALDHYAWSLDLAKHFKYMKECRERGVVPLPDQKAPNWRPSELPGKRAYNTAHQALDSKVETLVADFMEMDLDQIGTFDVVLFLGVLYHMENPLEAMKRVAAVTREVAIIETAAVVFPGFEHVQFCEFFESNELDGDMSNWWAPNLKALEGICRAAGFRRLQTMVGPPWRSIRERLKSLCVYFLSEFPITKKVGISWQPKPMVHRYRAVVHAYK